MPRVLSATSGRTPMHGSPGVFYKLAKVQDRCAAGGAAEKIFVTTKNSFEMRIGGRYSVDTGAIHLCGHGFHACKDLDNCYDSTFGYTKADCMLRVSLEGDMMSDQVKTAARTMTVLEVVTGVVTLASGIEYHFDDDGVLSKIWNGKDSSLLRYRKGALHSTDAEPSEISTCGTQFWHVDGIVHRDDDKPALIKPDGTTIWFKKGVMHRDGDRPAYVHADGTLRFYKEGKLHRDDDKPALVVPGRNDEYYHEGQRVRKKNPGQPVAVHYLGEKVVGEEYVDEQGLKHREGGPAFRMGNVCQYFEHGLLVRTETIENDSPTYIPLP